MTKAQMDLVNLIDKEESEEMIDFKKNLIEKNVDLDENTVKFDLLYDKMDKRDSEMRRVIMASNDKLYSNINAYQIHIGNKIDSNAKELRSLIMLMFALLFFAGLVAFSLLFL